MLYTTRGIVFQQIKYSESSLIVKILTEELGVQSFIVKGAHSKKSKSKPALFQPLTLLNLVVDCREGKSLHYLKEITVAHNYQTIHSDILKQSMLLFLTELLSKSIREESPDKSLFAWLFNALTWFDLSTGDNNNFHLIFMVQLSRFLGFYPKQEDRFVAAYFDLQEGRFTATQPEHPDYVQQDLATKMVEILNSNFEEAGELQLKNKERRGMLDALLMFYRLHIPGFGTLKSTEVLKTILA